MILSAVSIVSSVLKECQVFVLISEREKNWNVKIKPIYFYFITIIIFATVNDEINRKISGRTHTSKIVLKSYEKSSNTHIDGRCDCRTPPFFLKLPRDSVCFRLRYYRFAEIWVIKLFVCKRTSSRIQKVFSVAHCLMNLPAR